MMNSSFDLKDLEMNSAFYYYAVHRKRGEITFFISLECLKQDEITKVVQSKRNDIVSVKEVSYWEFLSQSNKKIEVQ